jgi:hypothetical protein
MIREVVRSLLEVVDGFSVITTYSAKDLDSGIGK